MQIFFAYSAFKFLGLYTCLASPLSRIRIKNKKLNKFLKAFESLSIPAAERMPGRMFSTHSYSWKFKVTETDKGLLHPPFFIFLAVIAIVPSN